MRSPSINALALAAAVALVACASPGERSEKRRHPSTHTRVGASAGPIADATAAPVAHAAREALEPASTHALIAGVLSWQDPHLTAYDARHRKDQELHDLLRSERAVPADQIALLLDRQATKQSVLARLERAARAAPASGTLIFYYAGHGVRGDDGGVYFANWDIETARLAQTGLGMRDIEAAIAKGPAGLRVILLADCCFSGALREVAERLSRRGMPAVSLTSADASNSSTQNWTFTQTTLDALRGDSLADRDADGAVELGELAAEVNDAMKFRERQRAGFAPHGVADGFVLARAGQGATFGQRAGSFALGDYGTITRGKKTATARVRRNAGGADRLAVRLFDYADAEDVEVEASALSAIAFERRPKDAELAVLWGGRTWAARVLRTDGDFHLISYTGWPSIWDEWILSDRFAAHGTAAPGAAPTSFAVGAKVEVEWGNKWWKAVVIDIDSRRYRIHYEGYEASYDEWVGSGRLRPR